VASIIATSGSKRPDSFDPHLGESNLLRRMNKENRQGGNVLVTIFFVAVALWTLIFERFWYLKWVHPERAAERRNARGKRSTTRRHGMPLPFADCSSPR
jgi:hypothetical protein